MRKTFIAALFAAATLATPAMAQDQAPFTGFRAEGVLGWDRLSGDEDSDAGSNDGVLYGAQIGYDLQAGRAIVGIEGEVTGSTTDVDASNVILAGDRFSIDAGRDLYVGARAGVAVTPRAMLYAKAGYTNARFETDYRAGTIRINEHDDLDGFRLGAGAEVALSPSTYLKGEYRYSNYAKLDGEDIDLDRHQLLAGIGVRF